MLMKRPNSSSESNNSGLFVGFNSIYLESESARSPTSPLDFRIFSSLGNPFRCPRVSYRKWDCSKVGLSIIDSLDDDECNNSGRSFVNKNILFGRKMCIRNHVDAQKCDFRSFSLDDSGRCVSYSTRFGNHNPRVGSVGNSCEEKSSSLSHPGTCFIGSVPTSEIRLSEDYTCVRTHGPNPKVTHIYGDCILECCNDMDATPDAGRPVDDDFLKFCRSCCKKLDGEDIYMYRGEKAFCSYECRLKEIEMDEEIERTKSESSEVLDESSSSVLFIAI